MSETASPRHSSSGGAPTTTANPTVISSAFIDAAPDAILVVHADGTIALANHQALDLFDYAEAELVGASIDSLVPSSLREQHVHLRNGYQDKPQVRRMGDARSQQKGRRSDGSKFPVEIALSPVVVDGNSYTMAIVRNVTERVNAERQQAVMRQRLAISEDRERIARDLHDLVIQRLFATGMRLQSALNDPERLKERATGTISELDETIVVLRDSIFQLTNPAETLSTRVQNLLLNHDVSVQCDVDLHLDEGIDSLPAALGEQLVPTISEALSNVVRHARASTVAIRVGIENDRILSVRVIDDGVGVDPDATPGSGLANLRERAAQFGGTMNVCRLADGGTDLGWTVPVKL